MEQENTAPIATKSFFEQIGAKEVDMDTSETSSYASSVEDDIMEE